MASSAFAANRDATTPQLSPGGHPHHHAIKIIYWIGCGLDGLAFTMKTPGLSRKRTGVFAEAEVQKWWDRLSDDERTRVKTAAEEYHLDAAATELLIETGCPIGPVGTRWASEPEPSWSWPESVRMFVIRQGKVDGSIKIDP
jgi:hypothetical protein